MQQCMETERKRVRRLGTYVVFCVDPYYLSRHPNFPGRFEKINCHVVSSELVQLIQKHHYNNDWAQAV